MKKLILFLIFASGFMIAAPTPDLESLIELEELRTGQKIKENPDFLELQTSTIKTEEDESVDSHSD